jgi:hypothetical protein
MNKIPVYIFIISLLFCLALGFLAGSITARTYINSHFEEFAKQYMIKRYIAQKTALKQPDKKDEGQIKSKTMDKRPNPERFEKELGLSKKQSEEISAIIKRYDPEINGLRKRFFTELSEKFEKVQREMLMILNESQKKKFEKMLQPSDIARMELSFLPDENNNSNK